MFRTYREFISTLNIERNELFKIQDISTQNFSQYFTSYENVQTTLYQIYDLSMTKTNVLLDKNVITRICNRLLNATYIDVYAIGIDDIIGKQLVYRLQSLGLLTTLHDTFNQKYVKNTSKNNVSIVICLNASQLQIYEITEYLLQNHIYTVSLMGSHHQQLLNMNQDSLLFYTPENQDMDGLIEVFSAEYVINLIYAILKGRKENNMNK